MPFASSADARIHYEITGSGPDVLFLQGVGVSGRGWAPQVRELSADHRCIVVDNRGIGASEGASETLTVEQMARDALAVLDDASAGRAHVVGHSLGGVIAQRLALVARERVRGLTLMCTFRGGRDLRVPSLRLAWHGAWSRWGATATRTRSFLRLVMPDAYIAARGEDELVRELVEVFGRSLAEPPAIADRQLAALRAHDERERLGELAGIPTYVASATLDPIARVEAGRALAASIPGATFEAWPDASHALPIQRAAEINARLRSHFAGGE
jgi:pimeloyl-ACP methyl ester carboxylesterase